MVLRLARISGTSLASNQVPYLIRKSAFLLYTRDSRPGTTSSPNSRQRGEETTTFRAQLSQFFPPKPAFTEADIALQHGRVFIVTGGASGIGLELTKVLYQKGGRVYIAGRSEDKARQAIQEIQTALPPSDSYGSLDFLHLDLADLTSIKASADAFKANESRLDVLWNNAGVSQPPLGSVSKQGIELQLATNCLGPFLFTHLLLPLLESTSAGSSAGSVRVI
jgi:hypothetical protein